MRILSLLAVLVCCVDLCQAVEVTFHRRGILTYLASSHRVWIDDNVIHMDLANLKHCGDIIEYRSKKCQNLRSITLGGRHFEDSLIKLAVERFPKLELVVLDSVESSTVANAQAAWPKMEVWQSQRSAINRMSLIPSPDLSLSKAVAATAFVRTPTKFPEITSSHGEYVVELGRFRAIPVFSPPLADSILRELPYFHTLKRLDLSETSVTDESLKTLLAGKSLEVLSLEKTKIKGEGLSGLNGENLVELDLRDTSFSGDWLAGLKHLEKVVLSDTSFSDRDIESLLHLPNLRQLYIARTKVTPKGLATLRHLKKLSSLVISYDLVNTAEARMLRSQIDGLKINKPF